MRAYLTLADGESGRLPLEGPTAIYRDPDRGHEVVAATEDGDIPLGIADITVSRAKDGSAPVVIEPRSDCVEVRNGGNSNGVTVRVGHEERSVGEGYVQRVERDAEIEVGYETCLRLSIERQEGDVVVHEGEGDVVMGDQTKIDDSVINRSDIGTDE